MKFILTLLTALFLVPLGSVRADDAPKRTPNILFVLADDLGWGDLRCYVNPQIDTPVLDALAKEGVRLTAHYSVDERERRTVVATSLDTRGRAATDRLARRCGLRACGPRLVIDAD